MDNKEQKLNSVETADDLVSEALWTMKQLAKYLNVTTQTLYDYRYRQVIEPSIFIPLGRKIRVHPKKAVQLANEGKLVNLN